MHEKGREYLVDLAPHENGREYVLFDLTVHAKKGREYGGSRKYMKRLGNVFI